MRQNCKVDLLIVGAGPSGLMMGCWASQFDIKTRIVDESHTRVETGRADGLQPRTLEILDSFRLAQHIISDGATVDEICSWNPKSEEPDEIERTQRTAAQVPKLSRYSQTGLNQGAIEGQLLQFVESSGRISIERNTKLISLSIDDDLLEGHNGYPIQVSLSSTKDSDDNSSEDPVVETVDAKYVVGCDGAFSSVRDQLNIEMEGGKTDKHFGVMDIVPLTNFPDIRQPSVIHSKHGSIMTVPRENKLVRFYVQLDDAAQNSYGLNPSNFTAEAILSYSKLIFQPYHLDFKICDWSSVYTVGQRLAAKFDHGNRVFLTGDAAHTHTPTMGQGMNVSIQDSYNLGWKICSVLEGSADPGILSTYALERRPVAKQLLDLDQQMAEFYSKGPSQDSEEYQNFREHFSSFMTGVSVTYAPNLFVCGSSEKSQSNVHSQLARDIRIGQRLPPWEIACQSAGLVTNTSDLLQSNGSWRIVVLPGDVRQQATLQTLKALASTFESLVSATEESQSQLQVFTIHSSPRASVDLLDLPDIYHPWDPEKGWDYWKVYTEEQFVSAKRIYDHWGVSRDVGCAVVVRPDQHVSAVFGLDESKKLHKYFHGFQTF